MLPLILRTERRILPECKKIPPFFVGLFYA